LKSFTIVSKPGTQPQKVIWVAEELHPVVVAAAALPLAVVCGADACVVDDDEEQAEAARAQSPVAIAAVNKPRFLVGRCLFITPPLGIGDGALVLEVLEVLGVLGVLEVLGV
jgi:hypothetical protein